MTTEEKLDKLESEIKALRPAQMEHRKSMPRVHRFRRRGG
jgi:primosomal protein N''